MQKIHGRAGNITGIVPNMQFVTLYTVIPLDGVSDRGATANAVWNLERFNISVGMATVPVISTVTSLTVDLSVAGNRTFYGLGTDFNAAGTTVYVLKYAFERPFLVGGTVADVAAGLTEIDAADASKAGSLASILNGVPVPFGAYATIDTANPATKNTSVNFYDNL